MGCPGAASSHPLEFQAPQSLGLGAVAHGLRDEHAVALGEALLHVAGRQAVAPPERRAHC